jgi:hypothetical protein
MIRNVGSIYLVQSYLKVLYQHHTRQGVGSDWKKTCLDTYFDLFNSIYHLVAPPVRVHWKTFLHDPTGIHHCFLRTLVYQKVAWWGLQANSSHDELGHSSNLINMENEEFPKRVV